MLISTKKFILPKPVVNGLAIVSVVGILGGIYAWDISRADLSVPIRLEGNGCDSDGNECLLVQGSSTKVQLKNCEEGDEMCQSGRFALNEIDGGVEVYTLKTEAISFIDEEIIVEVAEVGTFLDDQDRYVQVDRAAAMATECELPDEGEILGENCYDLELPENLRESETEERRGYVELRDEIEEQFE